MTLVGYADCEPCNSGSAYIDPFGGITGAAMILTALLARQRSGRGGHIELSLREATLQWLGEHLVGTS